MSATKKRVALSVDKQDLAAQLFVKLYALNRGRTAEYYAQEAFDAAGVFLQTYEVAERVAEEAKAREEAEAAATAESSSTGATEDTDAPVDNSQNSQ